MPAGLAQPARHHVPDRSGRAFPGCQQEIDMAEANVIKEHMEVIGSDGGHVGTVDSIDGSRIKLTKSGSEDGQHHYVATALVQDIRGNTVTLTKPAAEATGSTDDSHPEEMPDDPQMGIAMDNG
jgi:hypothetical protein